MDRIIASALSCLQGGGTLLYPTDTLWGIGCDARDTAAVNSIYELKERADTKALICLVANEVMLKSVVGKIDERLLPYLKDARPTTIIYPQADGLSPALGAEDGSVGIRIPKDSFCQKLISALGAPLVSTSANISGQPSPLSFEAIDEKIKLGVTHVVNHRQKEQMQAASRIIRLDKNGTLEIIRP